MSPEKVKAPVPPGIHVAAILAAVSIIASMLTGVAFLGATFPTLAGWLFGLSLVASASALILGLFLGIVGALEPRKKNPPGEG